MKYARDLPPLPSTIDHAHPKPERMSPIFKDVIGGCLFLVAVFMNVYLILGM